MSPKQKEVFFLLFAGVALVGFMVVYYQLFTGGWTRDNPPGPNFTVIAEGLTGLVGGIVAASFGQTLPAGNRPEGHQSGIRARLRRSGAFLGPFKSDDTNEWLAGVYTFAYAAFAIVAIVVFMEDDPNTPALVGTLATVSFGLGISIVAGGFRTS